MPVVEKSVGVETEQVLSQKKKREILIQQLMKEFNTTDKHAFKGIHLTTLQNIINDKKEIE